MKKATSKRGHTKPTKPRPQTPAKRWALALKKIIKVLDACGPKEVYCGFINVNTAQYVTAVALCEFKEAWDNPEKQEAIIGVYGHGIKDIMQDILTLEQ
jgi:hypothetical protein